MTAPWWAAFPPAETSVPCGAGQHRLRWEEGRLIAADHPDAEGELVLAALGGERAHCVELVQAWGARSDDLDVLALGPRSASDELTVNWEWVTQLASSGTPGVAVYGPGTRTVLRHGRPGARVPAHILRAHARPVPGPRPPRPLHAARSPHVPPGWEERERARSRRAELLSLFALGAGFQFRLSATVAAAWDASGPPARGRHAHRPALTAALAGRLAPAAGAWLGIDPEQVRASLHEGPGWGSIAHSASRGGGLDADLPLSWLSSVWAAGLALTGGHLVTEVQECAWPDARVLALPAPDAEPVVLRVRADGGHWWVRQQDS